MKMRLPIIIIALVVMAVVWGVQSCFAFDVWKDIQTNTNWDLGKTAQAGTSIILRSNDSMNARAGQFVGSALAGVADYRFLGLSAGGTFIPQGDGSLKAFDTAKVGINLGYFLTGFTNQPPDIIKNLVFGPTLITTLVTTPHVFVPGFDFNVQFGK